jgi:RimJ/RimL family protein N-acetyltransferase
MDMNDLELPEESFVDFKCPYCGELNSFPAATSGVVRECVNCQDAFLVPEGEETIGRKLPLPFETPSVRLRRFKDGDWKDLLELGFKDEIQATDWLNEVSKVRPTDLRQAFYLAAEMKATGKIRGYIGVKFVDAEFEQIAISSDNPEGRGMVEELEAHKAALSFCFEGLRVHRVVARCPGEDLELRQLMTKSGMRQEAEFIRSERNEVGQWRDVVWFAMLEEEYFSNYKAMLSS